MDNVKTNVELLGGGRGGNNKFFINKNGQVSVYELIGNKLIFKHDINHYSKRHDIKTSHMIHNLTTDDLFFVYTDKVQNLYIERIDVISCDRNNLIYKINSPIFEAVEKIEGFAFAERLFVFFQKDTSFIYYLIIER